MWYSIVSIDDGHPMVGSVSWQSHAQLCPGPIIVLEAMRLEDSFFIKSLYLIDSPPSHRVGEATAD